MELIVFNHEDTSVCASDLGLDAVMVDLEQSDKHRRQCGADTDISTNTLTDLATVRASTELPVICRIDGLSEASGDQIERVIDHGADEILIPMVRLPSEVERVLELVDGRGHVGIMVETVEAVAHADELGQFPLSRAYVGLNDLWIARRSTHRFSAFSDGTIDRVAESFQHVPFGVAGLTHPDLGSPLACHHIINELVRLDCDFTFLRRSFFAASELLPAVEVVDAIRAAISLSDSRGKTRIEEDRQTAWKAIDQLLAEPLGLPV